MSEIRLILDVLVFVGMVSIGIVPIIVGIMMWRNK